MRGFRLFVHNQKVFGQAFGGVGEGGGVPIFNEQHEVFDDRIDFQRFGQLLAGDEVVFHAGGCKLSQLAAQEVEESVLALREQDCVDEVFFVVQVVEDVRDEVLVVKD